MTRLPSLRLQLPSRLEVLARWPRRLAAATCLVLAAGAALAERNSTTAARIHPAAADGPPTSLQPGQVAVPVQLAPGAGGRFIRPGDHVGLLSGPTELSVTGAEAMPSSAKPALEAPDVLVLSVLRPDSPAADRGITELLVATDRPTAQRIAALGGRQILAIMNRPP